MKPLLSRGLSQGANGWVPKGAPSVNVIDLLKLQFAGINGLINEFASDFTDAEWTTRVTAQTDLPGFIFWHVARVQDWAVQTAARGVPEVIQDSRWQGRDGLSTPGVGTGFTRPEADQIASAVSRLEYIEYANAVHQAIRSWLSTLTEADLEVVPDMVAHQAGYPEYQRPSFHEKIKSLIGQSTWRLLLGPSNAHVRLHLGEVDLLKQLMRSKQGT